MLNLIGALCLHYQFINEIGKGMTKEDKQVEKSTMQGCARVYNSCLKTLIKKGVRNYWAICGEELKKNESRL